MNIYTSEKIRNVALLSHSKAGKTSLAEAMLYDTGVISRIGKTEDGNTVCDYDSEEIKRVVSIRSSLVAIEYANHKINIVDTPGYFDFVGDMYGAISACDVGLIVASGKSGAKVGGEIAFKQAEKVGMPVMFFINKMDHENCDHEKVLADIHSAITPKALPLQIPIVKGGVFEGIIDIIDSVAYMFEDGKVRKADVPDDYYAALQNAKAELCEAIAETDEALMDKFFSEEPFTLEDFVSGTRKAIIERTFFPVMYGSATANKGVDTLLNIITRYAPSPADMPAKSVEEGGATIEIACGDANPLCARVFKTVNDSFVGKVSFVRLYSGSLSKNATVNNSTRGTAEKLGGLMTMRGKEKIELDMVHAGDIFAVAKLGATKTGDTFAAQGKAYTLEPIAFPEPLYTMAFEPKAKGDEDKIAAGLAKLVEEDTTLKFESNSEIRQLLVSGLGDQHLDVVVARLKAMGTEVTIVQPKVTYRETITKKIQAEGKHKKQSGGHGQYGHVKMEFEPCDSEELIFEEKIFGGSVPKNYHPAVEKGLLEMMPVGIQAGYKVVGVKATLYDGSYHDVDSSEMAFKMAAHLAFKELVNAGPILLEPIGHLEVLIPDEYTGDIMGDINKRRGRVLGIEPGKIIAEVPMSEMNKYAIELRSMTQGRGEYTLAFERYEQAPPQVVQKVMSENN